jgi:predicted  nucleic acid-binding Zn-ribbon protein
MSELNELQEQILDGKERIRELEAKISDLETTNEEIALLNDRIESLDEKNVKLMTENVRLLTKIAELEKDLAMVRCVVSAYPESYKRAEERGAESMAEMMTCDCEDCCGENWKREVDSKMQLWREKRGGGGK